MKTNEDLALIETNLITATNSGTMQWRAFNKGYVDNSSHWFLRKEIGGEYELSYYNTNFGCGMFNGLGNLVEMKLLEDAIKNATYDSRKLAGCQ